MPALASSPNPNPGPNPITLALTPTSYLFETLTLTLTLALTPTRYLFEIAVDKESGYRLPQAPLFTTRHTSTMAALR